MSFKIVKTVIAMKFTYKIIIILAFLMLFSVKAFAGTYYQIPKYVQSKSTVGGGTEAWFSLNSSVTAGNLLTAVCYWASDTYTASISDGVNNWQAVGSPQTGSGALAGYRMQAFYAANVSAGTPTIYCNISSSVGEIGLAVHEVSGAVASSPLDQNNSGNTSGTTHTSPSVTTTQKAEYALAGCAVSSGEPSVVNPWNLREAGSFNSNFSGDRSALDIGSYNTSVVYTASGDAICDISTFKGASYGGTTYTPPAYVQGNSANQPGDSSVSVSFSSNVTAGNVIALAASWYSTTATLNSVTDDCNTGGTSNSYTLVNNPSRWNDNSAAMAYAVIGKSGSCTVTATFSASVISSVIVHEISGVNTSSPIDKNQINTQAYPGPGIGTDALTSGSVETTINGDYIFGFSAESGDHSTAFTAGAGFTSRKTTTQANVKMASEDRNLQYMYGPVAATFTTDKINVGYATGIMAFKPANAESEGGAGARIIRLKGIKLKGGIRLK